jgi:hypothetical protein
MDSLTAPRSIRIPRSAARAEDWLLTGWIAIAAPLLAVAGGTAGPFDAGHPLQGLLQLIGFGGALACLATRNSDASSTSSPHGSPLADGAFVAETAAATPAPRPGVLDSAAVGPLTGGLLLVGGSAFAQLGLAPESVFLPTLVAVVALGLLQARLPAVPTDVRRAFVTPYLLAAGGLFWGVVHEVTGSLDLRAQFGGSVTGMSSGVASVIGLLALGAAVYYAMLIYAPRQIAEREGGPIVWVARFALFLAGVALGLGWLSVLGG